MEAEEQFVVTTATGSVQGAREKDQVVAFRGIPYAASPVGPLRFAPPRPHPRWSGVRSAQHAGPSAPQGPSRLEQVMGARTPDWDEDGCLTLNIWTPEGALETGERARPVLVWFHGGGFSSGSGGWEWYDGARLAALGDIVVVTANYRLGPLGYLYLPDLGIENLGCQDQGAVLRWVRENVAAFGGDPELLTAGGQSAGAFSSVALMCDPDTGPLLRRMIVQSCPWGLPGQTPDEAAEAAAAYLRLLDVTPGADAGTALRQLPVERLLDAYGRLAARAREARPADVAPPMYPVLGAPGMPRSFRQAIGEGAVAGKDVLIGSTTDEMTAFFAFRPAIRDLTTRQDAVSLLGDQFGGAADKLYDDFAARRPGARPARVVTDIVTDRQLGGSAATDNATFCAEHGANTFVYLFTRTPEPDPHDLGAAHCAELPFLFGTFDAYRDAPMLGTVTETDHALARAFGGALAAFTATGSPDRPGPEPWQPYAPGAAPFIKRF
ncbi:carboxylesterase [Streptomyces griseocarneus]|nr:carboxylesterase [Streptomyces griseocarneus]